MQETDVLVFERKSHIFSQESCGRQITLHVPMNDFIQSFSIVFCMALKNNSKIPVAFRYHVNLSTIFSLDLGATNAVRPPGAKG